ncbi:fibrinogen-like protein 1 [Argopecten irradians]|uniref:fibrinogen-like protein 1 n=1 Tax=Argopecten irradians TaxID=31199 RepID=UPI003719AD7E
MSISRGQVFIETFTSKAVLVSPSQMIYSCPRMFIYMTTFLVWVTSQATIVEEYFTRRMDCDTMVIKFDLTYTTRTVSSYMACASLCLMDSGCESANFILPDICMLSGTTLDKTCCNSQPDVQGTHVVRQQLRSASVCLNGGIQQPTNSCVCIGGYIGEFCERIMEDCTEGVPYYPGQFGTFLIHPKLSPEPFKVVCRMQFDKRTFVQIRHQGGNETLFVQTWDAYKKGFGDMCETTHKKRNFWLGNEKIYFLTNSREYSLVMQVADDNYKSFGQIRLNNFMVKNENNNFAMSYTTTFQYLSMSMVFGNSMLSNNGAEFSTFDRDSDASFTNCAQRHGAGWWFVNCSRCNPNGRLWPGGTNTRLNVDDEFFWEDGLSGFSAWGTSMWLIRI